MATQRPDKRSRLISAATKLFHENGYESTSIAKIADEACVQLGNVYYYFKTKDEIGAAVVQYLAAKNRGMRDLWETGEQDPIARLCAFVQLILDNSETVRQHGCPTIGLCSELRKAKCRHLADQAASIVCEMQTWVEEQFELSGKGSDAEALAAQLMCAVQGSMLISHVCRDTSYLAREMCRLQKWLRGL